MVALVRDRILLSSNVSKRLCSDLQFWFRFSNLYQT